jgi:hypothetical protein
MGLGFLAQFGQVLHHPLFAVGGREWWRRRSAETDSQSQEKC